MILTFPGMAAQKESETISENMRWSYQKRMESGDFNCCKAAYGYELIDGQLYINEAEAVVIRRIFKAAGSRPSPTSSIRMAFHGDTAIKHGISTPSTIS